MEVRLRTGTCRRTDTKKVTDAEHGPNWRADNCTMLQVFWPMIDPVW
jgi:hypothetical protein